MESSSFYIFHQLRVYNLKSDPSKKILGFQGKNPTNPIDFPAVIKNIKNFERNLRMI